MADERSDLSLVVSTFPDEAQARSLSHKLVEERLIACGNVLPGLTSIYRWQGQIEEAGEVLLIMKTRAALVASVFERVGELHPYDVPEMVELRPGQVAEAYARWVLDETTEVTG